MPVSLYMILLSGRLFLYYCLIWKKIQIFRLTSWIVCGIINLTKGRNYLPGEENGMAENHDEEKKIQWLKENGVLNPAHEKVKDELFQDYEFFDPHDLIQVKYEMLRRVQKDSWTVSRASKEFGFSRVSFYESRKALEEHGVADLIPRKRGPKAPRKLTDEVMHFVEETMSKDASLRALAIAELIEERFGFTVHPRSIQRALERRKKKRRSHD